MAPAPKKNKIVKTAAADRENAAGKEIDAGKEIVAGKEIGTVTEVAAEMAIFPETGITLANFFEDTDFAAKTDTSADILRQQRLLQKKMDLPAVMVRKPTTYEHALINDLSSTDLIPTTKMKTKANNSLLN